MNKMITQGQAVFMETYAQFPLVLTRGKGRYVYDTDNKRYLDMVAGIAVNILGYGDPVLSKTLQDVFVLTYIGIHMPLPRQKNLSS